MDTYNLQTLSRNDAVILLEIISASLVCNTEGDLCELMSRLSELLPYQAAISCLGSTNSIGIVDELNVVNVDYPDEYLSDIANMDLLWKDPIVIEHFKHGNYKLRCWADFFKHPITPEATALISLAEDHGLDKVHSGHGYSFGISNLNKTEGSLFAYHGLSRSERTEAILGQIVPHFHEALRRVLRFSNDFAPLTTKETEILKWVKEGKNTWDISTILSISERTVKFHISNSMKKLNASSRTHAVAKAMELGLLHLN